MKISHPHKICYVLPEYREDDDTHFSYIGQLLRAGSDELDIFLIIERGVIPSDSFGCKKIHLIGSTNFLVRSVKLKWWIFWARFHGYRDFYVHYSFLSALMASIIVKVFGGRVFYWNCGEPWKYQRSYLRERFERLTYFLITFLVTGTEKLGDEYSRVYKIPREKIKIMPNWVDSERFQKVSNKNIFKQELAIPEDRKVIFFVHHLSVRKGTRMILPVIRELLKFRKDFFVIVAGSGPDEASLRERVNKTDKLSAYARIVGAIPNHDIQKYFNIADILFMPSQEEGFPRVILESMASGVPIVASNVGSVSEIVPKEMKSFIVDPNDMQGFASALNLLLSQKPEEIEKTKTILRSEAEKFKTATVAKKFVTLFI
jgi:glycosyltransferase involved in cell wall biosynthesis